MRVGSTGHPHRENAGSGNGEEMSDTPIYPPSLLLGMKHIPFANPESMKMKTNVLEAWKLGMYPSLCGTLDSLPAGRKTN